MAGACCAKQRQITREKPDQTRAAPALTGLRPVAATGPISRFIAHGASPATARPGMDFAI